MFVQLLGDGGGGEDSCGEKLYIGIWWPTVCPQKQGGVNTLIQNASYGVAQCILV